jgi:hypothetical protein
MLEPPSGYGRTAKFLQKFFYLEKKPDGAVMREEGMLHREQEDEETTNVWVPRYRGHGGFNQLRDDKSKRFDEYLKRIGVAVLTGISLIAPMLVMKLLGGLTTQLVTASVSIIVAGIVLALVGDMEKKDVVSATAAYAAVLIVFVGASMETTA